MAVYKCVNSSEAALLYNQFGMLRKGFPAISLTKMNRSKPICEEKTTSERKSIKIWAPIACMAPHAANPRLFVCLHVSSPFNPLRQGHRQPEPSEGTKGARVPRSLSFPPSLFPSYSISFPFHSFSFPITKSSHSRNYNQRVRPTIRIKVGVFSWLQWSRRMFIFNSTK